MPSLIELTGKETKAQIIDILCSVKPKYETISVWDKPHFYRGDSKKDLLLYVKVYNANVAAGGNGNLSRYINDEAYSHRKKLDIRLKQFLWDTYHIDEEYIKKNVPHAEGLKAMETWREYLTSEHNDFIGHTTEEKDKAYSFMEKLFLDLLKIKK